MAYWTWNGGPRCCERSALARRRKRLRSSSDPLLRIEWRDADKRLHAAYPRAVRLRPLALADEPVHA